ncbi:oxygenase MpaB family protein [Angustibacter peucedani]
MDRLAGLEPPEHLDDVDVDDLDLDLDVLHLPDATADPDLGLFGPTSVTWRLHADPVLGLAGLRALMLQALHPRAAEAVGQHSSFREDVWGRLARTSEFVAVTTYGTRGEALSAGAHVRALHALMSAVDPATGHGYRVDEPELLTWVHCCLVDSVLDVLRRSGSPLDADDADRYVGEQVRAAVLVGLEPGDVPHDVEQLAQYFRDLRPSLRATRVAREEVSYVIAPPIPARVAPVARPAWSAVAGLAFAALPPWARRLYSMPSLPGAAALHGAATTVALHTLRASLRGVQGVVPPLRAGPHLRSARQRLAAAPDH